MIKITKRVVDAARAAGRDVFIWDSELHGFGLRVRPSGRRSFILQYRTLEGRQRRRVLGKYPILTADQARKDAREWLEHVEKGKDPAEVRDRRRSAVMMETLCEQYFTDHVELHKKASSETEDRRILDRYVLPALGRTKAISVSHDDVARLHKSMAGTPYMANRTLGLLTTLFYWAAVELRRQRPDWSNPCKGVKRYAEHKRRRYLSAQELASLGVVLAGAVENRLATPDAVAALRLLIFTGCRRGEILSLRWEHVDMDGRKLRLPDSKTGAKDVHLSPPAIEVLNGIEQDDDNPHVIRGGKPGTHLQEIGGAWRRLRRAATVEYWARHPDIKVSDLVARLGEKLNRVPTTEECRAAARTELPPGLEDVRIHDLRHSFASVGAGAGLSLPIIGALLGHSHPATTARYAHLAADPLQEAVDLVGARLSDALAGGVVDGGGKVVSLPRHR